jgi:cyanophycin synthetase
MLENVTDITHPQNIEAAALAVRLIGLDIAGVDYITTDIARPYYETGGAFTEVNPMPALAGVQRCGMPAYRLLLEAFFPPGSDGRIPTAVLLQAGDVTPAIVATEKLLAGSDYCIGVGTLGRFDIGGRPLRRPEADEGSRIRTVLADPRTTMALVQATPLTIGRDGLAIDRCDVGVVMMGEPESAGGTATPDAVGLAAAALIGAIARKAVVLGTDDPRAPGVAASAAKTPIIWVAPDLDGPRDTALLRPGDAIVALTRSEGGHAVTLNEAGDVQRIALAPARLLGSKDADRRARRAYLTAIAIARGLGLSVAQIAEVLRAPVAGAASSQAGVEPIS